MPCSRTLPIALILTMCLTACGGVISNNTPVRNCPVPRDYSEKQLNKAADELGTLNRGSMVREMMADYGSLRQEARDCWGGLR